MRGAMQPQSRATDQTIGRRVHGKGLLSLKDRSRSVQAYRLELEVIVCAEYSCDRIRPRQGVVEELEELEGIQVFRLHCWRNGCTA